MKNSATKQGWQYISAISGLCIANLSDYARALEYYGKALALDEELGNKAGVARHLGNIGNVHINLSDYARALEYYGKALTLA
jgi:tetratricopeptide (TPR) repeat protein